MLTRVLKAVSKNYGIEEVNNFRASEKRQDRLDSFLFTKKVRKVKGLHKEHRLVLRKDSYNFSFL